MYHLFVTNNCLNLYLIVFFHPRTACQVRPHHDIVLPGLSVGAVAYFVVVVAFLGSLGGKNGDRFSFIRWNFAACSCVAKVLSVVAFEVGGGVRGDGPSGGGEPPGIDYAGCAGINSLVYLAGVAAVLWLSSEAVFVKTVIARVGVAPFA